MNERTCPLCADTERYYSFLAGAERFEECRGCGLISHFDEGSAATPAEAFTGGSVGRAVTDDLLGLLQRYGGAPCRRLGIVGEAPATLLAQARQHGFEPVPLGLTTQPAEKLHAVLLLNELENQVAPVDTAARAHEALVPGGVLAVLTRQLVKTSWQAQESAILRKQQRHSFSDTNLQSVVWKAGFHQVVVHHFPTLAEATDKGWLDEEVLVLGRAAPRREVPILSVIVPVFNEVSTAQLVLDALAAKTVPGVALEIIVVESNSTDGSRALVQRYEGRPRFKVVYEDRPRGKGHAVRTGLQQVTGDVILIQDADLEYDFLDYDMLVEPVLRGRTAFVLGTRHAGHWKIRRFGRSQLADLMNVAHWALASTMNKLYGQAMTDPFTMFKVFRADCLSGLTFECDRFDFDIELVCKLVRKGYRPLEIPVNYKSRSFDEGKKVRLFRDPPTWVRAMWKYRKAAVVKHPALEAPPE